MLPNESFLEVLHFADYRTLVLAKRAARCFLHLVIKFSEELAGQRRFEVAIYTSLVGYKDVKVGQQQNIRYEHGNLMSLAAACREVAGKIGPHAVATLTFKRHMWDMPNVAVIFETASPLKYAENVVLHSPDGSTIRGNSEAFMSNFAMLKSLRLCCNYYVFCRFFDRIKFLRHESARELRLIKVSCGPLAEYQKMDSGVEELVRYCVTLPQLLRGETLELDFSQNDFSGAFGLQIIELLKSSGCEMTFRMRTQRDGGELVLDESEYMVDIDDTITRYTSKTSGIVVEVKGCWIAIQSKFLGRSEAT